MKLAASIRNKANRFYDELYADLQNEELPKCLTQVYHERIYLAMPKHLPDVKTPLRLHGSLELAVGLILHWGREHTSILGNRAYKKSIPTYRQHTFDAPADTLFFEFSLS